MIQPPKISFLDWETVPYKLAWDNQTAMFLPKVEKKLLATRSGLDLPNIKNEVILCEHLPVYTLGKSGKPENLLLNEEELGQKGIEYFKINRGGDITFHGPGQLVAYPIIDLEQFKPDIHLYMRNLEEVIIQLLEAYHIKSSRYEGFTGVWLDADIPEKARKICAMGVKCSRWVTMHGLALNVNTDLSYFSHIIPCGIDDKAVTSMEKELGKKLDMNQLKEKFKEIFLSVFGADLG